MLCPPKMVPMSFIVLISCLVMATCVITFFVHPYCTCSVDGTGIQGVSWDGLGAISSSVFGVSEKDHLFQSCLLKCKSLSAMNELLSSVF